MGEDPGEPQVGGGGDLGVERGGMLMPHAEAAHAGVDLEMDGDGAAGVASDGIETRHLVLGRNCGGEIVLGEKAILLRQQRAEQKNGPAGAELAQRGGLGKIGHGEKIGARVHQPGGGMMQPMAVGIGFHHGDIAHVRRQRGADEMQVALKGVEIDLGPATQRQAGWREGVHEGARWISGVHVA